VVFDVSALRFRLPPERQKEELALRHNAVPVTETPENCHNRLPHQKLTSFLGVSSTKMNDFPRKKLVDYEIHRRDESVADKRMLANKPRTLRPNPPTGGS
jgi:hypothetical protein